MAKLAHMDNYTHGKIGEIIMSQYKPPFTITDKISRLKSQIIKHEKHAAGFHVTPQMLHKAHIQNAHSTLAIEGSPLTLAEVRDIIEGNDISCTPTEMRRIKNAYDAYHLLDPYHPPEPYGPTAIMHAHSVFMAGLAKDAGHFRTGEALTQTRGISTPLAKLMPRYIGNLLDWVKTSDEHPLIKSSVFHYEIMTAKPFRVGNGLVARLWQTLLLYLWSMPLRLPLADFLYERRQEYFDTLAISDKAEGSTEFIGFMLQVVKDAVVAFDGAAVV